MATVLSSFVVAACGDGQSDGQCTTARDCAAGSMCISGQCQAISAKPGCREDKQCKANEWCDVVEARCKLKVDPPDGGEVAPDAVEAFADALPPDTGSSPDTGAAGPDAGPRDAVAADATGPSDSGIRSCTQDQQCGTPPRDICLMNQCARGCGAGGAACGMGTVCNTTTGHCVPVSMSCARDTDCTPAPPMRVCEATQCVPGCGQTGGIQCSGATPVCNASTGRCVPAPGCNADAECNDPLKVCVNRACVLRCDQQGGLTCTAPMVCDPGTGKCAAGNLALGAACTFDAACASGTCLGLTVSGMSREVCSSPCGSSANCPIDFSCFILSGMGFCLSEALFTPPGTFDVRAGGVCSDTNNRCQSGWCNTQELECIQTCSRDTDCTGFGGVCWTYAQTGTNGSTYDYLCLPPASGAAPGLACTANANCRSGICNRYDQVCAKPCCADRDCAAAESCMIYDLDTTTGEIVKICAPRTPTTGTSPLGASCTSYTNCESEVCAPTNLTEMNPPMKCSTTCCTDQDCTALPTGGKCRAFGGPTINMVETLVGICVPN